ncbi:MAG: TetR/AcrR family transcriptional regulator, partial [Caldimonas sp.]
MSGLHPTRQNGDRFDTMSPLRADRRTTKTRQALMGAFVELMLADGYDSLTVDAIVARANVGRSTFY